LIESRSVTYKTSDKTLFHSCDFIGVFVSPGFLQGRRGKTLARMEKTHEISCHM
jgi:hypothetical protein